jgi:nucleoside-diphosphate-sugar epimerase
MAQSKKNKRIEPERLLSHVKVVLIIALLGRRDSLTDPGDNHARLAGAFAERDVESTLARVPWNEMGRPRALRDLCRPGDQRIYIDDITKAQRDLDWAPKVTVAEGFQRMIEDWQLRGVATRAS